MTKFVADLLTQMHKVLEEENQRIPPDGSGVRSAVQSLDRLLN